MSKAKFQASLPLNLYYHLQLSCDTNPYLRNERYQRDFATTVSKDFCCDFYFAQDQYWFMQRLFIETSGGAQDLSSLEEGFARWLERYAEKELIPELVDILKRAFKSTSHIGGRDILSWKG